MSATSSSKRRTPYTKKKSTVTTKQQYVVQETMQCRYSVFGSDPSAAVFCVAKNKEQAEAIKKVLQIQVVAFEKNGGYYEIQYEGIVQRYNVIEVFTYEIYPLASYNNAPLNERWNENSAHALLGSESTDSDETTHLTLRDIVTQMDKENIPRSTFRMIYPWALNDNPCSWTLERVITALVNHPEMPFDIAWDIHKPVYSDDDDES